MEILSKKRATYRVIHIISQWMNSTEKVIIKAGNISFVSASG